MQHDPLRVGVFTTRDLSLAGGSLMRIVGATQYLNEFGCQVSLFAPTQTPLLENVVDFVPLQGLHGRHGLSSAYVTSPRLLAPLKLMACDRALAALIRERELDVVHAHQHTAGVRLLKIADRIRVPIALDVHGILALQMDDHRMTARNPLRAPSLLRMERHLFRRVDALIVRTEAERRYIACNFATRIDATYVVPDAADLEFLNVPIDPAGIATLRAEYDLGSCRIILFGGEFKSQSGILDLVAAYQLVKARHPDVALVLVGDGTLMPQVAGVVERAGLSNVVILGRQSRERFRLCQQAASVVVTPEIQSTYNDLAIPLKLLDCLASGRPTVATRIASHLAIVRDGVNGFLVEPSNPIDMASGIERALSAGVQSAVAHRAKATVQRDHSWRKSAADAVAAYRSIVAYARRLSTNRVTS